MNIQTPSTKQIAEEAIFQLSCSNEVIGWMCTLMTAIKTDQQHEGGRSSKSLADLGLYLAESHMGGFEVAHKSLSDSLDVAGSAV